MAAAVPHPFLLRLARLLLAKAERHTTPGPVRLQLDRKTFPELHEAINADQLQLLLMQLDDFCATGWVAMRLDPPRPFTNIPDRKPRLELCKFDELADWAGYTPLAQRWQSRWREHLAIHWAENPLAAPANPAVVIDYLSRNPLTQLEGLSLEEATSSLDTLISLCRSPTSMVLREASARSFQGRSKVLDHREELVSLLGATPGQFHESPIQLLLAPPDAPHASATATTEAFADVLFIENLASFEHMADVRARAWSRSLLIYAAGFRGSARRLRSRVGARLYLRAPAAATQLPAIESWLFEEDLQRPLPVHFFGDLDYAGMLILARLREVFPRATAWRPGYDVLAGLLAKGYGHTPEQAAKALQTDPGHTGCTWTDEELLPLLREQGRFIDQEAFDPEQ